jgi:hypothetical protein
MPTRSRWSIGSNLAEARPKETNLVGSTAAIAAKETLDGTQPGTVGSARVSTRRHSPTIIWWPANAFKIGCPTSEFAAVGAGGRRVLDKMNDDWSNEETNDPLVADVRNFYKVEKWTRDGMRVDSLFYAGNNLDKARDIFAKAIKHRPRIRLTIRQRTRVLDEWPPRSLSPK